MMLMKQPSNARLDELMQVQQNISDNINQKKVGKNFQDAFIAGKKETILLQNRIRFTREVDNEVLVDTKENYIRVGDFTNIKIYFCRGI